MPSKDLEKRRQVARDWRKRRHTKNYMRWLGQRRALHKEVAAMHEQTLLIIARTILTPEARKMLAENALQAAHQKRVQLGNRFDHDKDEPYWKE